MTYIENIFLCLAIPMILSLFFIRGRSRSYTLFVTIGMGICLLSAYVNSFFMWLYGVDGTVAAIEITPVCEELLIAIAAGFATFENACYLTENGAANFSFLLIRGISAGGLHILCGILSGFGISYVFRHRWLSVTGTAGILGACTGFHGIYNLLITADGGWKTAGYLFPSVLILCLFIAKIVLPKFTISLK